MSRFWAFQANPTVYDVERAVNEQVIDTWMTKRSDVQAGDRAVIWKSLGGSSRRGIVAFAEILTDPAPLLPENPAFWLKGGPQGVEPRVKVRYVVLPNCPVWATPVTEPILSRLSVWRGQGSIFRVAPEQWDDVVALAGGWPSSSVSEIERFAEELDREGAFDPTSVIDARERMLRAIAQRRGQPEFRARLIDAYGGKCAMTGCDVIDALEAAHIVPYRGVETNHVTNGLLLRSDVHTLFDLGLITVDGDSMEILVASAISESVIYGALHGRELSLPASQADQPSREALKQHRERFK